MPAERVTLHRTNIDKTEVIEQYPKTIASQVYDFDNGKFLNETLNGVTQEFVKISELQDYELTNHYRKKQALFTITIDDGGIHDYQTVLPILRARNVVATSAIIVDIIGNPLAMSLQQLKELQDTHKWEIASHSSSHVNLTTLNDEQLINELKGSRQRLNDMGLDCKNIFVPYGATNAKVYEFLRRYYRSARVSGASSSGNIINTTPINMFSVDSVFIGDVADPTTQSVSAASGYHLDSLEHLKYCVDLAIANGGWLCIGIHANALITNNRVNDFTALVDYVLSKNGKFVTYNQALNLYGNIVDVGEFKVGSDGKIGGSYGKVKKAEYNTITALTPVADIDSEYITFNLVTSGLSEGLPTNAGGTILTVKPDGDARRAFQLFKAYDAGTGLYMRGATSSGWQAWRRLDDDGYIKVYNTNALPSSHTPNDLAYGMINYCTILLSGAAGYPDSAAGFLFANRISDNSNAWYEEYRLLNANRVYERRWLVSENRWSPWSIKINSTQSTSNSYTLTDAITVYPEGVSYCQIQKVHAETHGFPENAAGNLETRRIFAGGYVYQYYHLYNSTKTYKRVWKDDNTWSVFVKIND